MGYLFKILRSGDLRPAGYVDVPFLGAKVGEFTSWTLQRRGDTGPDAGLYDLRAAFSFVVAPLWNDTDFEKRIVLRMSPSKQFRLELAPNAVTVRQGESLLIERVLIHDFQGAAAHS